MVEAAIQTINFGDMHLGRYPINKPSNAYSGMNRREGAANKYLTNVISAFKSLANPESIEAIVNHGDYQVDKLGFFQDKLKYPLENEVKNILLDSRGKSIPEKYFVYLLGNHDQAPYVAPEGAVNEYVIKKEGVVALFTHAKPEYFEIKRRKDKMTEGTLYLVYAHTHPEKTSVYTTERDRNGIRTVHICISPMAVFSDDRPEVVDKGYVTYLNLSKDNAEVREYRDGKWKERIG